MQGISRVRLAAACLVLRDRRAHRLGRRLLGTVNRRPAREAEPGEGQADRVRPPQRRLRTGDLPGGPPGRRGGGQVRQHLPERHRRPPDQARRVHHRRPVRRPPRAARTRSSTSIRSRSWARADTGSPGSIPVYQRADLAYLGGVPFTPVEGLYKNAAIFSSISIGDNAAAAVFAAKTLKASTAAVIYTDDPQGNAERGRDRPDDEARRGAEDHPRPDPADRVRPVVVRGGRDLGAPRRHLRRLAEPVPGRPQEPQVARQLGEAARHRPVHRAAEDRGGERRRRGPVLRVAGALAGRDEPRRQDPPGGAQEVRAGEHRPRLAVGDRLPDRRSTCARRCPAFRRRR